MSILDRLNKEIDRASMLNERFLDLVSVKVMTDARGRIEELEAALQYIADLKPEPVADGLVTGPLALLNAAQRGAKAALQLMENKNDG